MTGKESQQCWSVKNNLQVDIYGLGTTLFELATGVAHYKFCPPDDALSMLVYGEIKYPHNMSHQLRSLIQVEARFPMISHHNAWTMPSKACFIFGKGQAQKMREFSVFWGRILKQLQHMTLYTLIPLASDSISSCFANDAEFSQIVFHCSPCWTRGQHFGPQSSKFQDTAFSRAETLMYLASSPQIPCLSASPRRL